MKKEEEIGFAVDNISDDKKNATPWDLSTGKLEVVIILDLLKYKPGKRENREDIKVLRELAEKISELSSDPGNSAKIKLWKEHNALKNKTPLVLAFPENGFEEIIPYESLKTRDPYLREYEWFLRSLIAHPDFFGDDYVITTRIKVPPRFAITAIGMDIAWEWTSKGGSKRFIPQINQEDDIKKFAHPELIVDREETERDLEYLYDIFGDILQVEIYWNIITSAINTSMVDHISMIRGLEQFYFDFIERPGWVHKVMEFFTESTLKLLTSAEENGYLGLNNADDHIGSGSLGWSDELPRGDFDGDNVRLKDLWGFSQAQDLTSVSPAMIDEFILPYQMKILDRFGLNYYGCCEVFDNKFDIIKKIRNLRKVSVSPFTDIKIAAEKLEDKYIAVWKPNPAELAMDEFDPDPIRKVIKNGLEVFKGCFIEIIMKDTHTFRNDPDRIREWVKITKELVSSKF
ncbi:MAG: hypothetical protein JW770_00345 [Actinobacteria bacterium]|nr:hypothetical protein [Actinomycetota bacterium]